MTATQTLGLEHAAAAAAAVDDVDADDGHRCAGASEAVADVAGGARNAAGANATPNAAATYADCDGGAIDVMSCRCAAVAGANALRGPSLLKWASVRKITDR